MRVLRLKRKFSPLFICTLLLCGFAAFLVECGPGNAVKPVADSTKLLWLNHADSVHYVGIDVCKQCHMEIYKTFIQTGMGQSFAPATKTKSAGKFSNDSKVYDKFSDFWYYPHWGSNDSLYITEYRLSGKDTSFSRTEQVNYIVGSGQHTNSHITNVNGYLQQMPMTFYTQQQKWDLPPGFENGYNSHFNRKIGLECMACHNAFPAFVQGSENQFSAVPKGIDCERCHGPGSLHVQQKQTGQLVDTSKYADHTIVNPGKLSPERQFDVCQRCHLQGNAVLKDGKSFYDFRPGMVLSDFITVFMPRYAGGDDEFIMASHADRLKMSQCFIQSVSKPVTDTLHPYKNTMTCVTCHNPHVSVKATGDETFNKACTGCHGGGKSTKAKCSDTPEHLAAKSNNCVSCHMPRSGAIDIPHVSVHDHYIRKPQGKKADTGSLRQFIGLYAVNEKNPAPAILAKAYIQQFEKFEPTKKFLLDSAKKYLPDSTADLIKQNFSNLVHLYYMKQDYAKVRSYVMQLGTANALALLQKTSWSNDDAWTAYRIGEAFEELSETASSEQFFSRATTLAPNHPDFRNKYAFALASQGKNTEAKNQYETLIKQYPKHVSALTNLGYLYLLEGNATKAESLYNEAAKLDPDYESLIINRAALLLYQKKKTEALKLVRDLLKRNPKSQKAKMAEQQILASPSS